MALPTSRLAVELAGLSLQNPLFLASGTAGYGASWTASCDLDALGGLVTKAVSVEPRHGAPAPRVAGVSGRDDQRRWASRTPAWTRCAASTCPGSRSA